MTRSRTRDFLARFFVEVKWGEMIVTPMLISVFSGVVLALKYDPSAPYSSVVSIELLVPFGRIVRGLHYYASQLFFVLFIFHLLAILLRIRGSRQCENTLPGRKNDPEGRGKEIKQWLLLVAALPVSTLLLFTGYVLKMDATGRAAGAVAENILLSLPLLGPILNRLLFNISESGLTVVYANHLAGLGLLWLVLLWNHLRRYRFRMADHGLITVLLLAAAILAPTPITPEWPGVAHLAGPWFFAGMQELLRYLQPIWAGIVFPTIPLAALLLIPCRAGTCRWGNRIFWGWIGLYGVLSILGWGRGVIFPV